MIEEDIKVGWWVIRWPDKSIDIVEFTERRGYDKEIIQTGSELPSTVQEFNAAGVEFLKWFDPKDLL